MNVDLVVVGLGVGRTERRLPLPGRRLERRRG